MRGLCWAWIEAWYLVLVVEGCELRWALCEEMRVVDNEGLGLVYVEVMVG